MRNLGFKRQNLVADLVAGGVTALLAIPDAVASAFLAGVNPTYAFNALMVGVPVGSLLTSSHFMNIGLTSAMMLAVADALRHLDSSEILIALFTLTLLIGLFQFALGILKLGKFTQFISNTVMVGFVSGIAVLVMLGQLGDLTGYASDNTGTLTRALDILLHPGMWDPVSVAVGLSAIALIVLINRTRAKNFSVAIALIIVSVAVLVFSLDSVALIGQDNPVSGTFPLPVMPNLALIPQLSLSALAICLIGLVQAAGISQSIPNPDGEYPDPSRDFWAQGVSNIAAGIFSGLPLGGSLGGTGIVMSAGAKSRFANVFLGGFVAIFVLLFARYVDLVAMPAIAGVLIVVGIQIIDTEEIRDIWDIGRSKRIIMVVTFIATLVLPVAQAILIGVLLSFIDYVYTSSRSVGFTALSHTDDGKLIELPVPDLLPDNSVTILFARGSYYFAAARTIQDLLPSVGENHNTVVILRLRGVQQVGSTFITVLERYAKELSRGGGALILSGLHPNVLDQLRHTETTDAIPEEHIFVAHDIIGASTAEAHRSANDWLSAHLHSSPPATVNEDPLT